MVAVPSARPGKAPTRSDRCRPHPTVGSALRSAILCGAVLISNSTFAQNSISLPVDMELRTPRLEVDLSNARIEITIDPERPQRLSARFADPNTTSEVFLEGSIEPNAVTRLRRADTGDVSLALVVEIGVTPDQVLVVRGNRVGLTITQTVSTTAPAGSGPSPPGDPPGGANPPEAEETPPKTTVDVSDSVFSASNLDELALTAYGGSSQLDSIGGTLALDLRETEVHARRLRGPISVSAINSDVTIDGCRGLISVDMEGGLLAVTEGASGIGGTFNNSNVEMTSTTGAVVVNGSNTSTRITDSADLSAQLTGTDLRITLDDVSGPIRADMTGGSLTAESIANRFDLKLAAQAEADLRDLEGDVAVLMSDGARATIRRVALHTRVRLEESELEVSDLRSFELNSRGGFIFGDEIHKLSRVESDGSDMDLSLSGVNQKHSIALSGPGSAVVRLPTPCRVVAKMPNTTAGSQLKVSGCLLDFDGTRKRGLRPGIDGQAPILLNATLDEIATLKVEGL